MAVPQGNTTVLKGLLDRLAAGDQAAADELIEHAMARLGRLATAMVRDYPRVRRKEETADVLQNALMRLHRALKAVKPTSVRDFVNLAALQIGRELKDLARHHYGPHGDAGHEVANPKERDARGELKPLVELLDDPASGPTTALQWQDFHEQVKALPDEEREVFQLIFYMDMSQEEVAKELKVSIPTVKRRWRSARLLLHEAFKTTPPNE